MGEDGAEVEEDDSLVTPNLLEEMTFFELCGALPPPLALHPHPPPPTPTTLLSRPCQPRRRPPLTQGLVGAAGRA